MNIEELQELALVSLREHGEVDLSIFIGGEYTVFINTGAEEVHVKEGRFEGAETPFVKVYHIAPKVAEKPQLDHDHNGKAGGSMPKAQPVKRKPVRK